MKVKPTFEYLRETVNHDSENWMIEFLKIKSVKEKYGISDESGLSKKPLSGAGVKVAVIDDKILVDRHFVEDKVTALQLIDDKAQEALQAIQNLGYMQIIELLKNFQFNPFSDIDETGSHGTEVSAFIAGKSGIAPGVDLLFLNVYEGLLLKKEFIPLAIYYAISQGVKFINISQDISECSRELFNAVKLAYAYDVIIVCGSGNSYSRDGLTIEYPAAFQKTLAIGGYNNKLDFYLDGDRGKLLDFLGPAVAIPSAISRRPKRGTSVACAIITGILALFIEKYKSEKGVFPSYNELKNILKDYSIKPLEVKDISEDWGYGIVYPDYLFKYFEPVKMYFDQIGQEKATIEDLRKISIDYSVFTKSMSYD